MDKGKTDWTDALRRQLADYEAAVPDDMWAGIEQKLDAVQQDAGDGALSVHGNQHRRRMPLLRWGVAASLAVLVAGGSYVLLRPSQPSEMPTAQKAEGGAPVSSVRTAEPTHVPTLLADASLPGNVSVRPMGNGARCAVTESKAASASCDDGEQSLLLAETSAPQTAETSGAEKETEQSGVKAQRSVESLTSSETQTTTAALGADGMMLAADGMGDVAVKRYGKSADWSVRLYGENGVLRGGLGVNAEQSGNVLAASSSSEPRPEDVVSEMSPVLLTAVQNIPVRATHHMPVSVGLQVGIPLWRNLSLSTGLVYTQARSEFTDLHYGAESTATQTLHYVGVPVGLDYGVWSSRWVRTYIHAGAEGAVCVSNYTVEENRRVEDAPRDRMQWSTQIAAGVQLDILPQLGVYAEPGVKYYFDNGSSLDNTFKKRKLNFNFQLGLRWNIK